MERTEKEEEREKEEREKEEKEEKEEQTVSLLDVLQEDEQLEEEASAVLAGSDSDHCSYPEGYVKRQALYACLTCSGAEAAGVCLACSYKCHEGHDLYELYTKRNFRCDCGNKKFPELTCKLYPEKDEVNSLNKYSQNFSGLYCICNRPYPDPEDTVEDEMIQCVVCEDWLHGRHLGRAVPDSVETTEMICESCMNKNPFLWSYAATLAVPGESQVKQEVESNRKLPEEEKSDEEPSCKRLRQGEEPMKGEGPSCRLKELQTEKTDQSGAAFWPSAWRSQLCRCCSCKDSMSRCGLSFLLEETDTVLSYETKGQSSEPIRESRDHDVMMSAMDHLNRTQQLDIIHGYNDMKTELKDFLQNFASEGKVVTSEDIRHFFEQQKKRRRDER